MRSRLDHGAVGIRHRQQPRRHRRVSLRIMGGTYYQGKNYPRANFCSITLAET